MTNNELPINCPKCKRTMRLDDSVENIGIGYFNDAWDDTCTWLTDWDNFNFS